VQLEKLVVARKHRGKGVGDGLVKEFFRRLAARDVTRVETGYFQPEYLRRYGFRTDPTSGGLVRDLDPSPSPDGSPAGSGADGKAETTSS
jgi:predicted N-acetyltransferase YhbS